MKERKKENTGTNGKWKGGGTGEGMEKRERQIKEN